QHVLDPDRDDAWRQGFGGRLVAVEPNSGDARQSRRRLLLHGLRALFDLQVGDGADARDRTRPGGMSPDREEVMAGNFEPEQKRYLEGFVAGLEIAKAASNIARRTDAGPDSATAAPEPTGPDAPHWRAQDRVTKAGGKLSDQEKFKREL